MMSPSFHRCGYAGSPYRLHTVSLAPEKLIMATSTCRRVNSESIYPDWCDVIIVGVSLQVGPGLSSSRSERMCGVYIHRNASIHDGEVTPVSRGQMRCDISMLRVGLNVYRHLYHCIYSYLFYNFYLPFILPFFLSFLSFFFSLLSFFSSFLFFLLSLFIYLFICSLMYILNY